MENKMENKMENNNFEAIIKEKISERYPDASVSVVDVTKANEDYRGLTIRDKDAKVAPTINLTTLEKEMREEGHSVDWAVDAIDEIYQKAMLDLPEVPEFTEEYAKEHLHYRLLSRDKNPEIYETSPCQEFNDLILVPYIDIESTPEMSSSARVTYANMSAMGLTEEKVKEAATRNMIPVVKTMNEVMREIMSKDGMDDEFIDLLMGPNEESKMYVCTNGEKNYGAACIFFGNTMEKLSDELGDSLYLLPSSVHECLIIPASTMSYDDALKMVTDVNRETVSEEDFLSDNVYFFDKELKKFEMQ